MGVAKPGAWPAMLEMWTRRLGLLGLALAVLARSQWEMASWEVRIGWVRLMSRRA
jgi:hypothetical protein